MLRDELVEAVSEQCDLETCTPENIIDVVWEILEERVGSVQEKLMETNTNLRVMLEAKERREEALLEIIRNLSGDDAGSSS